MAVSLGADVLHRYRRFSRYNSPYVAHERGCAIDLYPDGDRAPSPVAGEVVDTRTVRAPPKQYAADEDHLILIDTGEYVARVLHVDPDVEPGDCVAVGEPLGDLVRAGFFAPWVPEHIHLGFRAPDLDPYRASGSEPITIDVYIEALDWDGTGTVVETGDTWARLDAPTHPAPGEYFVGVGSGGCVLEGGFPHYESGGMICPGAGGGPATATLAGTRAGTVSDRHVSWDACTVWANGVEITGISLFCARDGTSVKLVDRTADFAVGEDVTVRIEPPEG